MYTPLIGTFKLKNPRKGTETAITIKFDSLLVDFQIKESPEGDWNRLLGCQQGPVLQAFQIKESPEGDWNLDSNIQTILSLFPFKLKNPRKGTETR